MSSNETGRVAVVTGAGRGIGRAMTLGLIGDGVSVMASDIDADVLAELQAETKTNRLSTIAADVASDDGARTIVAATLARFGRLDILVNNAGTSPNVLRAKGAAPPAHFWEVTPAEFRRVMEVNALGAFMMSCAVLEPMRAQKWGRIINVTTSLDSMWRKGMLPYGGSKAANEAHCAIMAEELAGTGITVNILVPGGPVNTRLVGHSFSDAARLKLIQPDIMVTPLLWLVSDATDAITGKRFIAAFWDKTLAPAQAAEKCSAPIAWQQLGRQAIFPDGKAF
jgi:3-oxoacyl-[acyl-carrier protein] reductase